MSDVVLEKTALDAALQAVAAKFIAHMEKSYSKEHWPRYVEPFRGGKAELVVSRTNVGHEAKVVYKDKVGHVRANMLHFNVDNYPTCCSMKVLHNFAYNQEYMDQASFEVFMDAVFKDKGFHDPSDVFDIWYGSRRLMCAMVEKGFKHGNPYDLEQWQKAKLAQTFFEPGITGGLTYQWFYDWFKKQAKCVVASTQFNANSCKMIHLIETVVDVNS